MKQNGVVCWPGHSLLFFIFRFEYLVLGPKSYRDFRETGPWFNRFTTGRIPADAKGANMADRIRIFWILLLENRS